MEIIPKITIVLSAYNGTSFLQEQLDSISQQTNTLWYLIVRDDGSADDSPVILKIVQNHLPHKIEVIQDSLGRLGPSNSFSQLLSCAQTPYMMLSDQDDVWLPDKIDRTFAAMRAAEERFGADTPLLVHTDLRVVDRELQPVAPSFWKYQNLNSCLGMNLNRVMPQNVVTGCTVMINRPLAKLAAPIHEGAIMHDWWLALVAVLFGQVVYLDEATVLYRQHGENSVGAKRWGIKTILKKAQSKQEVRASMLRTMRQAQALLERYRDKMSPEQIAMVEAYAQLPFMSKTARVGNMLKYDFFMHGMIRNIGFLANLLTFDRSIP